MFIKKVGVHKMNIKALFLDIDGTFFDHETNSVLKETLEACKLMQKKGYKVALCSGRPKEMAEDLHVFDMMEWDGYIGCSGGIAMNEKYEVIYQDGYSEKQMNEIFSIAEENDIAMISFGKYEFITKPFTECAKKLIEEYHLKTPEVRKWNQEALGMLTAIRDEGKDIHLFEKIEGISLTSSTPYGIDLVKDGVNKAKGISHLMDYWGFEHHEYIAFGDSSNDVEMVKHAAVGVAMGNGNDKVKAVADIICGNSNEPTIMETLKQLQLL